MQGAIKIFLELSHFFVSKVFSLLYIGNRLEKTKGEENDSRNQL